MNRSAYLTVLLAIAAQPTSAQQPVDVIDVVGQTPLGAGVAIDQIASNVQSATAESLRAQRALDLTDFMRRNMASVFVNEAQSNPLQPDLQYRGFVGSPLLGLPQGLAVYQDGVRINEPFGDTVNWALIPESAINAVYLMPGSNPLFGLNALGGAISVETKSGFTNPGTRAEIYAGSFGRLGVQAETGGTVDENLSYFLTGSWLEEDGWREFSPTEAAQLFGAVGWRSETSSVDVSLTLADTDLIGNGAAPVELLAIDREAIFTRPDQTENDLAMLNLVGEHRLSSTWSLKGNAYFRASDIDTLNGDDSDFEECEDVPGFICLEDDDDEELIVDQDGNLVPADDAVEGATANRSGTRQESVGVALQGLWTADLAGRDNLFVVGASFDDASVDFDASTELGSLDETRQAIPSGVFVGDAFTELKTSTTSFSVFISNTLSLTDALSVSISGRYNNINVRLEDQLGTALNGDHDFDRFNPAIGLTARLSDGLSAYAGYSESSRSPSPVELTCADEDDPCRLPNAFLADPPLEQVVAKTFEAGLRGTFGGTSWHAGVFRATNEDDIQFISAGSLTNQGFFDNVGDTRRDGVEIDLLGELAERFDWYVNYTYLDATFRESLSFPSPNNPAAIDGEVFVEPGDRLPLVPRHLFKGGVRAAIGDRITIGGEVLSGSDFHLRGDEGNELPRIGDYTVLNLRADYRVSGELRLFVNVDNALDEEYETFGLFGEADEVLGDEFEDSTFVSPAAPRAAWVGLQIQF